MGTLSKVTSLNVMTMNSLTCETLNSGWDEGIAGMQVGGERVLTIPPNMGYGKKKTTDIPPNSTLTFGIILISHSVVLTLNAIANRLQAARDQVKIFLRLYKILAVENIKIISHDQTQSILLLLLLALMSSSPSHRFQYGLELCFNHTRPVPF